MPEQFDPPGDCPVCGTAVPSKASACPGCGACHASGWSDQAADDALDLPGTGFDDDAFVADTLDATRRKSAHPAWWIVTVILLILILVGLLA
jgi:hypothetical protein